MNSRKQISTDRLLQIGVALLSVPVVALQSLRNDFHAESQTVTMANAEGEATETITKSMSDCRRNVVGRLRNGRNFKLSAWIDADGETVVQYADDKGKNIRYRELSGGAYETGTVILRNDRQIADAIQTEWVKGISTTLYHACQEVELGIAPTRQYSASWEPPTMPSDKTVLLSPAYR